MTGIATQATKSLTSLHLLPKYKDSKWNFHLFSHSFKFHGHWATHPGVSPISIALSSVKATPTAIWCKYALPQISFFPLRCHSGKRQTQRKCHTSQCWAMDPEPALKRPSSRSTVTAAELLPPQLKPAFALVFANPPVTLKEAGHGDLLDAPIFSTPYTSTKRTTLLEAKQLKWA